MDAFSKSVILEIRYNFLFACLNRDISSMKNATITNRMMQMPHTSIASTPAKVKRSVVANGFKSD